MPDHPPQANDGRQLDWIIVGETAVLLAPEPLHILAASERDGALALLTTSRSKVSQVFVSPNLRPAFGVPETLTVTRDRALPPLLSELGGYRPVALRLALDHEPRPMTTTTTDDDLERRIKALFLLILAQFLADARTSASGGDG